MERRGRGLRQRFRPGPAPAPARPPAVPGSPQAGACHSVLIRDFSPCCFSVVEYPLQLLHSPPAPVVKRPGAMAAHHPLQVGPCARCQGSSRRGRPAGCPLFPPLLWSALSVSAAWDTLVSPWLCVLSALWGTPCRLPPSDLLDVPQEPSQPLNLTAKPKAPELPNTSSSPSLKMGTCGPRPPSHGASARDRPSSPPSLPLGELSASAPGLVASCRESRDGVRPRACPFPLWFQFLKQGAGLAVPSPHLICTGLGYWSLLGSVDPDSSQCMWGP